MRLALLSVLALPLAAQSFEQPFSFSDFSDKLARPAPTLANYDPEPEDRDVTPPELRTPALQARPVALQEGPPLVTLPNGQKAILIRAADAGGPIVAPSGVWAYAKPISLASSSPIFGEGRDGGVWNLTACNDRATATPVLQFGRIMSVFPELRELTPLQAGDALHRKAQRDPRSKLVRILSYVSGFAGDGLIAGGFFGGIDPVAIAGFATKVVNRMLPQAQQNAPSEVPYLKTLLPEEVTLQPGQCGTWLLYSGLVKGAKTLERRDVPMPGVVQ